MLATAGVAVIGKALNRVGEQAEALFDLAQDDGTAVGTGGDLVL